MISPPEAPLVEAAWIFTTVMALVLFVPIIAERVRIPPIVGLVVAGMLVGPGVAGLLEYEGFMEILGEAGLLYLMFLAGLELDLDDFEEYRGHSIRFGSLGFLIPMLIGTAGIFAMGLDLLAAILMAAAWASHTLLVYPTFRRHGTVENRAVATSVGATIFTDTAALLVLVVVIRAQVGDLDVTFWGSLIAALGLLVVLTLWALPRVGRWFYAEHARKGNPRFMFALVVLFGAAAAAELGGLEAIIGAFLAGLGMNRLVPTGSALMERVDLFGETFFIPLFLLSVGLLIEPAALADPHQLALAAGFIAVVAGSKFLAAWSSGRWFGWERGEIGAAYSLTVAQAAATLAIVIVGIDAGVLDGDLVNATVLTILVVSVLASWLGERYAPALPHSERERALGEVVVVPVARPAAVRGLNRIAADVARADGGYVVPLTVASPASSPDGIQRAREMNEEAQGIILETGGEAEPVLRIDASPESGILNTLVEHDGSMLILGWAGHRSRRREIFGSIIDGVLAEAPLPTLVVRPDGESEPERVVVLVTASNLTRGGRPSLDLGLETARRLARPEGGRKRELLVIANTEDEHLRRLVEETIGAELEIDRRKRTEIVADLGEDDLVVLPVKPERDGIRGAPAAVARAYPRGTLVVAYNRGRLLDWSPNERPSADDDAVEDDVEQMGESDPRTPKVEGARPGKVELGDDEDADSGDGGGAEEDARGLDRERRR